MSAVYRVRKLKQDGNDEDDDILNEREEALHKVYDPRLCQERALSKSCFGVDINLKWRQPNEEKARQVLQSENCPSFTHGGGFFGLLMATHEDFCQVARRHCKEEQCKKEACKSDREPETQVISEKSLPEVSIERICTTEAMLILPFFRTIAPLTRPELAKEPSLMASMWTGEVVGKKRS